jgi:hypothetical protein
MLATDVPNLTPVVAGVFHRICSSERRAVAQRRDACESLALEPISYARYGVSEAVTGTVEYPYFTSRAFVLSTLRRFWTLGPTSTFLIGS